MTKTYDSPGIYVEEVATGTRPIEAVGTSTVVFGGESATDETTSTAVAVNNWSEFVRRLLPRTGTQSDLARSVFGFFNNGGRRCYVATVRQGDSIAGDATRRSGLGSFEEVDEIALVAAPGRSDSDSHDALLTHCEKLEDRFALLDSARDVADTDVLKRVATVDALAGDGLHPEDTAGEASSGPTQKASMRPRESEYGAFYFPWIVIKDPFSTNANELVTVPPSGHIAGIYARTDATRGVHKAPANEPVRGARGLNYRVTRGEQGDLNRAGVNCIRYFPEGGIRVWGARTLASSSSEWRYINVRRLFNMVKESIHEGTRWTVFEPNDKTLWKSIQRDLTPFLTQLWRVGALVGSTREQAFFVKCDEETNPPEVRDAGRLVTEIGIAPVKPAEFIVFRIGQWSDATEVAATADA